MTQLLPGHIWPIKNNTRGGERGPWVEVEEGMGDVSGNGLRLDLGW